MENLGFALDGAWKVLLAALVLGAGLPAVFAVGIRAMALGEGGSAEVTDQPPRRAGFALACLCAVVVLAGIGLGLTYIIASGFGKELSFSHVYPTLVAKE